MANEDNELESMRRHLADSGTADRLRRLLLTNRDGTPVAPILDEAQARGRLAELTAVLTGLLIHRLSDEDYAGLVDSQWWALLDNEFGDDQEGP